MSSNGNGDGCTLKGFTKNAYFFGKLMTVADMIVEQRANEDKLYTINRFVLGLGQVCGLQLQVQANQPSDEDLQVSISSGFAIDSCGRLLVVSSAGTVKTVNVEQYKPSPNLYLRYKECNTDAVPASDGCQETCCYSRIVEDFEVVCKKNPPATVTPPVISFPSKLDTEGPQGYPPETIARDYYQNHLLNECGANGEQLIYLGTLKQNGTQWGVDKEATKANRQVVYDNTMLYNLLTAHVLKFTNPHEVTAKQVGALVSINDVHNPGGDVELTSKDLTITPNDDGNTIDLELADALKADIGEMHFVRQYLMDKSLKYTLTAVTGLIGKYKFNHDHAQQIIDIVQNALRDRVYSDGAKYLEVMEAIEPLEDTLPDDLKDLCTENALLMYATALTELRQALNTESVAQVAVAQDEVCEMIEGLACKGVTVHVPDVYGKPAKEAGAILTQAGLQVGTTTTEKSAEVCSGCVLKQDPPAQTEVDGGTPVSLVIAVLTIKVHVPDVYGKPANEARAILTQAGLQVGTTTTEKSKEVCSGCVLKQDPLANASVFAGTPVSLVIAMPLIFGPPRKVPKVTGLSIDEAVKALGEAGYEIGKIIELRGPGPKEQYGRVLAQSVKAGTKVDPGTKIDITIAKWQ
ncbi:MAG: PASTA domain-containing protein [Halobacteriota archaeon]